MSEHSTIIPQVCIGYEMINITKEAHRAKLVVIISYPTILSGIIVLLKTPQNRIKSS